MSDYFWLMPALLCGVIALVGNVVLGQQVLKRQIIFIDLAVAQMAALGTAVSHYWLSSYKVFSDSFIGEMMGPWVMSLLLCGLIALMEKRYQQHLEPMIGSLFVVSASVAILLVSKDPHGGDFMHGLLNGQLLWATWDDVWPLLTITSAMLLLVWLKPSYLEGIGFYMVFAILMPITVKLTGIYLEFALLVIPALCAATLSHVRFFVASIGIGVVGIVFGLIASARFDLPSGASIVIALFLAGVAFNLVILPLMQHARCEHKVEPEAE